MRTFIYWLFSKTKVGKLLDNKKTEIGFILWLLGYLIAGLAHASGVFPDYPALVAVKEALVQLHLQLSSALEQVGLAVMVVGVGHKAVKENVEKSA